MRLTGHQVAVFLRTRLSTRIVKKNDPHVLPIFGHRGILVSFAFLRVENQGGDDSIKRFRYSGATTKAFEEIVLKSVTRNFLVAIAIAIAVPLIPAAAAHEDEIKA